MEESRTLARFAAKLAYEDLPETVVQKTKELILDQLGCQLAGSTLPWTRSAYEYVADGKGGRQESTVINYGLRTSAQDAAFVNASFGHGTMGTIPILFAMHISGRSLSPQPWHWVNVKGLPERIDQGGGRWL